MATERRERPSARRVDRRPLPERAMPGPRARRGHGIPADRRVPGADGSPGVDGGVRPDVMTAANVVTFVRIFATFLWIGFAVSVGPNVSGRSVPSIGIGLLVAALFGLIAFTDTLDGYLARSRNEVTDIGKFMDPIADKLICIGALLVLMDWGLVTIWVPVVVVAREFLVSGLRMVVASKGEVVAASQLGKWKTGFTMGAIAGYLVGAALPEGISKTLLLGASWIAMVVAVALTIWSGVDYFLKCRRYLL